MSRIEDEIWLKLKIPSSFPDECINNCPATIVTQVIQSLTKYRWERVNHLPMLLNVAEFMLMNVYNRSGAWSFNFNFKISKAWRQLWVSAEELLFVLDVPVALHLTRDKPPGWLSQGASLDPAGMMEWLQRRWIHWPAPNTFFCVLRAKHTKTVTTRHLDRPSLDLWQPSTGNPKP